MMKKLINIISIVMVLTLFATTTVLASSGGNSGGSGGANGGTNGGTNGGNSGNGDNDYQGEMGDGLGNGSIDSGNPVAIHQNLQQRRQEQKAEMMANRLSINELGEASNATLDAERIRIRDYKCLINEELQTMRQMTEQERQTLRDELQVLREECQYANRYSLEIRNAYNNGVHNIMDCINNIAPADLTETELEDIDSIVDDIV